MVRQVYNWENVLMSATEDLNMVRRSKRGSIKTDEVLGKLKEGRSGAIQVCREAKVFGPEYRAALAVTDSIDGLAEALTGDRKIFIEPGHSIGSRG